MTHAGKDGLDVGSVAAAAGNKDDGKAERRMRRVGRPAKKVASQNLNQKTLSPDSGPGKSVLLVDLNNFATFPTLAVGILVASLRNSGHQVRLMCPLSHDVPASVREYCESRLDDFKRRVHLSTSPLLRNIRDKARSLHTWRVERSHPTVIAETRRELESKPDVLVLSAYLQHFNTVKAISQIAKDAGVPVLLGGPMFNIPGTAESWRTIDGVSAVVGAESDFTIGAMVNAVCDGDDMLQFSGVVQSDGRRSAASPPLRKLDDVPLPDFSDFPWDRYPVRVIPMMSGRGCQWDKCRFCSDVVSVNGRTFRTKSVETILLEMQELSRRHDAASFVFLDLKLNSFPDMIRGIAERAQDYVQGAEWVGTVHVDQRADNGLSRRDLNTAVKGGMRRVSFGLETGSQRLLDLMNKGCTVEGNSAFIRNAYEAGLSVRCTMFKGFPGETAQDMQLTADFLETHARYLDRVRFNEFSIMEGTPIHEAVIEKSEGGIQVKLQDSRRAKVNYQNPYGRDATYRRAKSRALAAVYSINRRELRISARQFDGIM